MVRKCDLGILLGGPILEQQFNQLISLFNEHLKKSITEDDKVLDSKRKRLDETEAEEDFQWMSIPVIDPSKAIERVVCPSMEQFLTDYLQAKRPVILTGCIDHWPAMQKWRYRGNGSAREERRSLGCSFDYLIQLAGDRTVPIELGSRYSDDDWTQKLMTISDFVQQYCRRRVRPFL